jgi:predicted nucleic acid-binding protein
VRVLVDTNVVLDVLMAREPHLGHALSVFAAVESGRVRGALGATTVTTVFYLAAKAVGSDAARRHVRALLEMFDVASVDRAVLMRALDAGFADFEDAVLVEAARASGVEAVITRDRAGFASSTLPVFTPEAFLAALHGADAPEGR